MTNSKWRKHFVSTEKPDVAITPVKEKKQIMMPGVVSSEKIQAIQILEKGLEMNS